MLSRQQMPSMVIHRLYGSVGRALVSYSINMTLPTGRDIQRSQVRALLGTFHSGPLGSFFPFSFFFLFFSLLLFTFFSFAASDPKTKTIEPLNFVCACAPKTSISSTTLIVPLPTYESR
ncbi:hypothetical protein LY76DRAFT_146234 [Colletotrichum caudatum]|nr:hypothetical protein LY76DRAFT_146234 [Colletotrichum caudatum]